jgi:hypothetical protein
MNKATNQRDGVLTAGFAYRQSGAILPYQLDTGEFGLFNPTDEDKKAFASQETVAKQVREIQSDVATVSGNILVNTKRYFSLLWLIFILMLVYHTKKRPWQSIRAPAKEPSPKIIKKQRKIITLLLGLTLVSLCTSWWVQNQWPVIAKEFIIQWSIQIALMLSIPMGLATSLAYHFNKANQTLKSLMAPAVFLGLLGVGMVGLTE